MDNQIMVHELMKEYAVILDSETSLGEAWELFTLNRISGAPVVSKEGRLVGVLSQSDILRELVVEGPIVFPSEGYYSCDTENWKDDTALSLDEIKDLKVKEIMTETVYSVKPSDTIATAATIMYENKIHRLIVLENKKVMGVISAFDLLGAIAQN